jgi:hypothetical protein
MRVRWFVVAVAAGAAGWMWFQRRASDPSGDVVPADPERRQALADEAAEQSFPASDPPSYWARDAER